MGSLICMARYCFLGHVDPANLEEYRVRHAEVWPELLVALRDADWRNYSLFLRPDGLLIGYAESDDLDAAQRRVAETAVNARWQAEMARLFGTEGAPDEAWEFVPEVFNLEVQLERAGEAVLSVR
ncbi:MAG: L-rhamnose mutarotase [Propionicimonas sp.]